jgi:hypothetical protein
MLTAITFTAGNRMPWLRECTASVAAQRFDGLHHVVVDCHLKSDWPAMRLKVLELDQFVAFVDDEDIVMNDSLSLCLRAIEQTGCGVAFTRQRLMNADGQIGHLYGLPPSTHGDIARLPQAIHHLAVMRREALDMDQLREVAQHLPHGAGIDWAIRANAAAHGGAVHVPIIGYGWRRHPGQWHHSKEWTEAFRVGLPRLRETMLSWFKSPGDRIATWQPAECTGGVQCV